MSTSIRVPNYYDGVTNLFLTKFASDFTSSQQDALHQSAYVQQDGDASTQAILSETYATSGANWPGFVPVVEPATSTITLEGAKMPFTIVVTDDLGAETSYDMGNSNTSQVIAPPTDRTYSTARIIRRI